MSADDRSLARTFLRLGRWPPIIMYSTFDSELMSKCGAVRDQFGERVCDVRAVSRRQLERSART